MKLFKRLHYVFLAKHAEAKPYIEGSDGWYIYNANLMNQFIDDLLHYLPNVAFSNLLSRLRGFWKASAKL